MSNPIDTLNTDTLHHLRKAMNRLMARMVQSGTIPVFQEGELDALEWLFHARTPTPRGFCLSDLWQGSVN